MMARAGAGWCGRGRRRGPRWPRPAPSSSRCAFCTRDVRSAFENDGWHCTFECEVHVSASVGARRGLRPARGAPPAGPAAEPFVQICCKGPDRTGARGENR